MFTRTDLSKLMSADPPLGVSIFLPTHVRGSQIRQGPVRLKNLIAEAQENLSRAGIADKEVEGFLRSPNALIDDYNFWQHQQEGLALFLDGSESHCYTVPIPLAEQAVVGRGYYVRPLFSILEADGAFLVLTMTADRVQMYEASRFALSPETETDLPRGIGEVSKESDYENPVQASPVARPHSATHNIANAQVYGDSPPDWHKAQLVDFARRVAAGVDRRQSIDPLPLVLVADAEIGGHFQKFSALGPLLAGVIEINPDALDGVQLQEATYAIMQPRLEQARTEAVERCRAMLASGDARVVTAVNELVAAAYQGRVDTLLLTDDETVKWLYDEGINKIGVGDEVVTDGQDLLEAAAVQTLQQGGGIHVLPTERIPGAAGAAAILRY